MTKECGISSEKFAELLRQMNLNICNNNFRKPPRDVNRIKPFLEVFEELWKFQPDIRFGQMVYNLARNTDLFNIEDDKMLEIIKTNLCDSIIKEGNNV